MFHQEDKIARSGLADLFRRIEIVSEKDPPTYARVLRELQTDPDGFVMIGNSLRSDIAPVIELGGWGIHMPYHMTWALETEHGLAGDEARMREVAGAAELPAAVREVAALAVAR